MDDPINPKHYDGTACADIGERLSANSYQVLKYNWRLGKKDDPLIEIGKSIWYLDREMALADRGITPIVNLPSDEWFAERLQGVEPFVRAVALALISWNRYQDRETLFYLRLDIVSERARFESDVTGQETMSV